MRVRRAVHVLLIGFVLAGCVAPAATHAGGFSATRVPPGAYFTGDRGSRVLSPGPLAILAPEVRKIPSAIDGAAIQLGWIRPETSEKAPIILIATPYADDLSVLSPAALVPEVDRYGMASNFTPYGYAVAVVSVRGTGGSGGCEDLGGPEERADIDQAVTWLAGQSWSNGNVGMVGLSYDATTQWEEASTGNPHLRTIVPSEGVSNWSDYVLRNGTAHSTTFLEAPGYQASLEHPDHETHHASEHDLSASCAGAATPNAAFPASAVAGNDPTGYLAARDYRGGVAANYRGSIFVTQGFSDPRVPPSQVFPWIRALEANGTPVKMWLGNWDHAMPDAQYYRAIDDPRTIRLDWKETLLHWFDRWLKDDAASDLGPRIEVQDTQDRWRVADAWPPADATAMTLSLTPAMTLASAPASGSRQIPLAIDSNVARWSIPSEGSPAAAARPPALPCPQCAVFVGPVLGEAFHAAGLPRVPLTIIPSASSGTIAARLFVVNASARTLVGQAAMDVRYADGGDSPRVVTPGAPIVARMQFEPTDIAADAGDRFELDVVEGSSSERAPSASEPPMLLVVGGDASALVLDRIAPDPASYFATPSR